MGKGKEHRELSVLQRISSGIDRGLYLFSVLLLAIVTLIGTGLIGTFLGAFAGLFMDSFTPSDPEEGSMGMILSEGMLGGGLVGGVMGLLVGVVYLFRDSSSKEA